MRPSIVSRFRRVLFRGVWTTVLDRIVESAVAIAGLLFFLVQNDFSWQKIQANGREGAMVGVWATCILIVYHVIMAVVIVSSEIRREGATDAAPHFLPIVSARGERILADLPVRDDFRFAEGVKLFGLAMCIVMVCILVACLVWEWGAGMQSDNWPELVDRQSTPPIFAYDHTPPPPPPPPDHLYNPIDVIDFDSVWGLTVKNRSGYSMFVIDMQITQDLETKYLALGFDVASQETKNFPIKSTIDWHSLPMLADTWKDHVQSAIKEYGAGCLMFVYFSVNDSGLATMKEHYQRQGTSLGIGDATGIIRYRLSNSSANAGQTVPLVVTAVYIPSCSPKPPS